MLRTTCCGIIITRGTSLASRGLNSSLASRRIVYQFCRRSNVSLTEVCRGNRKWSADNAQRYLTRDICIRTVLLVTIPVFPSRVDEPNRGRRPSRENKSQLLKSYKMQAFFVKRGRKYILLQKLTLKLELEPPRTMSALFGVHKVLHFYLRIYTYNNLLLWILSLFKSISLTISC